MKILKFEGNACREKMIKYQIICLGYEVKIVLKILMMICTIHMYMFAINSLLN